MKYFNAFPFIFAFAGFFTLSPMLRAQEASLSGDASCDGLVNVLDVIASTDYFTGNNPEPFCFENADVNSDDVINILDIVLIVEIIIEGDEEPGGVTDIDGNVYETVIIGNLEWMTENLKTTHYNDGTPIAHPGDNNQAWSGNTTGAYAWYNNDEDYKHLYGALYNWRAVNNGNLCPEGWYVPEDSDIFEMSAFLTNNYDQISYDNIGNALKSCRQVNSPLGGDCAVTDHPRWDANDQHYGTDEVGYGALPGGMRFPNGTFDELGGYFNIWTSTERNTSTARSWLIEYDDGEIYSDYMFKSAGYSVRCVRIVE
jgi:uncharacterized protein (TIGR02145 family)